MKTKDVIAGWILFFFIVLPFVRAFYGFTDALKLNRSVGVILWSAGVALVVAASGLFLFVRFLNMIGDLNHYEAEEKQREKEILGQRSM
jgi:hypothetical protein